MRASTSRVAVALVLAALTLVGCESASSEVVDKAYDYCKNQVPIDAGNGELGDGTDEAEFYKNVEDAFDECVDLRINYYKDHPDAP
jgi:hypothetical protein